MTEELALVLIMGQACIKGFAAAAAAKSLQSWPTL